MCHGGRSSWRCQEASGGEQITSPPPPQFHTPEPGQLPGAVTPPQGAVGAPALGELAHARAGVLHLQGLVEGETRGQLSVQPASAAASAVLSTRPRCHTRLVLRQQHGLDGGGALGDVGEEGEDKGLGAVAVHVPAVEREGGERSDWMKRRRAGACIADGSRSSGPTHCGGASRQVPSIHRTRGRADSATLRSRRPRRRAVSCIEGATTTSPCISDSDTCRQRTREQQRGRRGGSAGEGCTRL